MSKMQELSKELKLLAKSIEVEATRLGTEQSKADKELVDIYHYIEFNNLSAADGFKAYKDLQKCLQYRRSVKNDIELANAIKSTIPAAKSIEAVEVTMNIKTYKPRVRKDLFPTPAAQLKVPGTIIARKDNQEHSFNSLDMAADMLIKIKGPKFRDYKSETIKLNILKAANNDKCYDGWRWSVK